MRIGIDRKEKEEEEKNICRVKVEWILFLIQVIPQHCIDSILVLLLSHFRDYINFQPTTRSEEFCDMHENFCRFSMCICMWNVQCARWFIVLTHIVDLFVKREKTKEALKE